MKLDTNGCFPEKLAALLDAALLDYVAMDVKNSPAKYAATVGVPDFDVTSVLKSTALLKDSGVPYEFRTTLVRGLHEPSDMAGIGEIIKGAPAYYLQNFKDSGDLVGFAAGAQTSVLSGFSTPELDAFRAAAVPYIGEVIRRN